MNSNLDERQLQKRNKAGNQSFILLACLLLADMGLHNYGIHWLDYPLSNYVIFLVGLGSYLVRIIWNGSYVGPGRTQLNSSKRTIYSTVLAVIVAASIIIVSLNNPSGEGASGRIHGLTLLITSLAVGLVIMGIVIKIRRNDNRDED